ncbi:MAG TPA: hypothetical protein VMV84_01155 [Dehalococcoidales bacterium]|nr:hypothetical protein [Dehalococcoidales bacterium]
MAIALRSVGVSPGANTATCIIVKPAGLTIGDLMVAHVVTRGASVIQSMPAGFALIRYTDGTVKGRLCWKIADAADVAAADFTFTYVDATYHLGAISAFTGHDPVTPINASNGDAPALQSVTPTSPEITPTVANCLICLLVGNNTLSTYLGYAIVNDNPGAWVEAYDFWWDNAVPISMAMGSAKRLQTTATGDGTATSTISGYWVAQLLAIAPGADEGGIEDKSANMGAKMIAGKMI